MLKEKWLHGAIPALLIHCSIGTVYCWSTFKESIASIISVSQFQVGFTFSLAIFFLGMSAAFCGRLVELDVHKSSLISCICFSIGMLGTGFTLQFFTGLKALILLYIFYGFILGIGLGIGYLTPIKTLRIWFKETPGLATGISIAGFGLAKTIATPLMEYLQCNFGIYIMFYFLAILYFITIFIGHLLIKKPEGYIEIKNDTSFNYKNILTDRFFIIAWLMFFLNVHCGLALISYEKQILKLSCTSIFFLSVVPSITAIFNAIGRVGYAALSDRLLENKKIYSLIYVSCIFAIFISLYFGLDSKITVFLLLIIVNAGYGGGFSLLAGFLASKYGEKNISKIHGLCLSAWGIAGLTGNNSTAFILSFYNSYNIILILNVILYASALFLSFIQRK